MRTATLRAKFKTSPLAAPNGARKAEFPTYIEPCNPTLQQRAPAGEDWVYEIKADGYRAQLHLEDRNATVYSRTGLNWTNQFSAIAEAAKHLKVRQVVLDGEAVVYGAAGIPHAIAEEFSFAGLPQSIAQQPNLAAVTRRPHAIAK